MECWILAGQSNMAGFAYFDGDGDGDGDGRGADTDERVMAFSSAGRWERARDPLHRPWDSYTPVHGLLDRLAPTPGDADPIGKDAARRTARPRVRGVGLGMSFGRARAEAVGGPVALLPAAHGGTSLDQWMPAHGNASRTSTRTLYGSLLDRVARARRRPGVIIRGILWYQGESDGTPALAQTYARRFDQWLAELRSDLYAPELEVVAVQLGRYVGLSPLAGHTESAWDTVRDAQRTLHRRQDVARAVSAIDLGLCDEIHIDASGLARLGRRLATLVGAPAAGPDLSCVELVAATSDGYPRLRLRTTGATSGWADGSLPGFELTDDKGLAATDVFVVDAHRDPHDPAAIEILCGPSGAQLGRRHCLAYGRGYSPVCSAVDGRDLPLPAFSPQPIIGVDQG